MPHRYTCRTCRTSGAAHDQKSDAEADRDAHRITTHGGMTPPDGDHIRYAQPDHRGALIVLGVLCGLVLVETVTGISVDDIARWLGLL
ncbi:hypothetical protein [Streptomyces sp. NPDC058045]|uniref:hypothetical protein n=1 Tax=Streptomyces sp. NPDC058045 TaxID=3346311 RepID=UPI0036EDD0F3